MELELFCSVNWNRRIGDSLLHKLGQADCPVDAGGHVAIEIHQMQHTQHYHRQYDKLQFPNCIGVMDGKQVAIRAPAHSGSQYHNYKHFHCIMLLALVDASYRLNCVDVDSNSRACDAGIYEKSKITSAVENNMLNLPSTRHLP